MDEVVAKLLKLHTVEMIRCPKGARKKIVCVTIYIDSTKAVEGLGTI